jgi:hypothetical protein
VVDDDAARAGGAAAIYGSACLLLGFLYNRPIQPSVSAPTSRIVTSDYRLWQTQGLGLSFPAGPIFEATRTT